MKHTNNTSSAATTWIGRMSLMVIALLFAGMANAQSTYYWVGGASGAYNSSASWNTTKGGGGSSRTTPNTGDILIFDGNNIGSGATVSAQTVTITASTTSTETISQLIIMKNTTFTNSSFASGQNITVNFSSGATVTVTNDIVVDKSCTFNDGGSTFIVGGNFVNGGTHSGTGKVQLTGSSSSTCMVYLLMNTANNDNSVSGSNYAANNVVFFGKLWVANTSNAYSIGDQVVSNGLLYNVTAGSGSNGATAPSGYDVSQTIGNYTYSYAGIAAQATISAVTTGAANAFTTFYCGNGYVVSKYTGNRVTTYSVSTNTSSALGSNSTATGGNYAAYLGKVVVGNISGTIGADKNIELNTNNSNSSSSSQANDMYCIPQASTNTASGTANSPGGLTVSGALTLTKGFLYLRTPAYGYSSIAGLLASTLTLTGTISCTASSGTTVGGLSGGTSTSNGSGSIVINNTTNTTVGSQVGTLLFEAGGNGTNINAITMTSGYVTLGTSIACGSNPGLKLNGGTFDDGGFIITLANGFNGTATTGVQHVSQGLTGGLKISSATKTLGSASSNLSIGNLLLAAGAGNHTILSNMTINGTVFFSNANVLSTNGFTLTMANGSGVNKTNATGNFTTPTGTLKYGASASDVINISIGVTCTSGIELTPTTLTGKIGLLTVSSTAVYTYNPSSNVTFNTGVTLSGTGTGALTISSGKTVILANGSTISRTGTGTIINSGNGFQYGTGASDRVNVSIAASVTSSSEITGTTGKVGTLTISGNKTYTLGSAVSLDAINVSSSSDILNCVTYAVSANSSTITSSGSGTIQTQCTTNPPLPATVSGWSGTVNYNTTAGGQSILGDTYTNLTLGNTSNTQTALGNLVVNGIFTTTSGGTLDLTSAYTLSGTLGTITNGGTLLIKNTSSTPYPSSKTWGGTVSFGGSGSAQSLPAGTYNSLNFTNTSGISMTGSVTVNTGLTFTGTKPVLTVGANTLTLKGTTLTTSSTGGNIDASNATATIVYNGSAPQTIAVNTFTSTGTINNLQISNSTGVTLSTPITVTGVLTLTTGTLNTDNTNIISITNTVTSAVTGMSSSASSSYINGPMKWTLPATGSGDYIFPVGASLKYYRLVLTNPTTSTSGTTVATVQMTASGSGGSYNPSTLSGISSNEYWSIASSVGDITGGNLSLYRTGVNNASFDAIGYATTSNGSYTSIAGSASVANDSIVNSNSINTISVGNSNYFTLATQYTANPIVNGISGRAAGTNVYLGDTITVLGNNFTSTGLSVAFNGVSASYINFVDASHIQAIVAANTTSGSVSVTCDGVTSAGFGYTIVGNISLNDGDWNTPDTWLGGVLPALSSSVTINNAVTVNGAVTNAIGGDSLTILSGKSLTFGSSGTLTVNKKLVNSGTIDQTLGGTLTISNGATFANSGTFTYGIGTVVCSGSATITGTTPSFYNLTLNGTLTIPATPTINNNLVFNTTTSSLSQVPTYGSSATLVYKAGPKTVGTEWANFKTGAISALAINTPGSGYTSVPTITGTAGSGLSATASLGVASITVTGSTGYTSVPTVSIDAPSSGVQATAVAYLTAGTLNISITNNGSGYTSVPVVTITGGGGSYTTATAALGIFGVSVSGGGTNYTSTTCTVSGSGGASILAMPSVGLGIPANVTIDAGSGVTITGASSARSCRGTLTVTSGTFLLASGGAVYMGTGSGSGGALVVQSGATLDVAGSGIFSTGTLNTATTNGTVRVGANFTTAYQYGFPANLTWGGTVQYYAPTTNNQRIVPGTFNNIDFDNGIANTINFDNVTNSSAQFVFNGTISMGASSSMGTKFTTVTLGGTNQNIPSTSSFYNLNLIGSGTTFPSGTVNIAGTFSSGSITTASQGTINFNGTHAQTIPAFNYNNLTISGTSRSGNVTLASSGTIGVANTLLNTATYTAPAALVTTGSTVNYNGTGASSLAALSYNNLTISGTRAGTPTITLPSGTINVAGTFTTSQNGAVSYTTTSNTINLNGSGTSTISSPFTHNILNLTNGTLAINAATVANGLAIISSGATLSVGAAYTNTGGLTNNGTLQMTGGSVSVAPTYVGTASLVYKNTATVGNEWGSGSVVGIGVPQVITFDAGSGTVTTPVSSRTVIGNLSIASGTLALGGDLQVNGDWTNNGTFTPNSNTVTFGGSSVSSITTPDTFYNLLINDAAGVNLSSPISVSNVLTLTAGVLTSTTSNLLTITNTSNSSISGGSSSSYVDGPLKWNLPSSFSSVATYTYPVGKNGTYLKYALVNPTTGGGAVSAKVEAFDAGSSGSVDGTLSGVNSEYWLLNTTGNYTGVGKVALTSASVANSSVVARSTGGSYTSLGGTSLSGTVSSVNTVGTGSTQYFSVGLIPGVSLGAITATSPTFLGQGTATGYYGQTLTINGSGFTGSTTVKINGVSATVLTHTTTQLTAKVPAASTASGDLIVYDGLLSDTTSFTVLGYVTNAATDWNTTTTWLGSIVPVANSNVFVRHAITINGTVTNAPANVSVVSGSSITYGASGSLTVNTAVTNAGTISMAAGGTLNIKGTISNTGTFTTSAGTVVFNGTTAQTIPAATYYNLSVTNTGATVSAAGALVVNGQLNIASGATLDLGTSLLTGTLTNAGTGTLLAGATSTTPIPTGITWAGTVNYSGTGAQTVVAGTYKNLTVSGTRTGNVTFIASGTVSVSGVFNPTATFTSGAYVVTSNTFTFNGATGQSIPNFTFTNLTLANSASVTNTAVGAVTVNSILTINSGVSLNMGTYQLLGSSLTTSGTGTLLTQVAATPIPTGRTWSINVTYNNPTGGQTVMAGTYNGTLNSAGTSGTNTTSAAITVNGALLIGAGHTLSISTFGIASASTIDPSGIQGTLLTMSNGAGGYQFPANKTWGGSVVYGGPINNRLVPGTFYNLDVDNGVLNNTVILDGVVGALSTAVFNISGTFKISPTNGMTPEQTTVNFTGTNQVLPACGNMKFYNVSFGKNTNMQVGSGMTVQNTFTPSNAAGSTTGVTAGSISFNNTNTQIIPAFNYYSLNIVGTRTTNNVTFSSASALTIPGNFTVSFSTSSGVSIGNTINLTGAITPVTNVSATLASTSTITCATTGLDIGMTVLGSGIPVGATISTIGTGTITISAAATLTGSSTLSFYPVLNLASGAYNGKVTIPSGKTFYTISGTFINTGGSIVNSGTLNAISTFSNNGTISGSGTTYLVGTTAQSISGTGTVSNLTLNNSAGATVSGGNQSITGILKVAAGNLNTGTNGLTLKSTSIANSAVLDVVDGTLSGTATVERFIPKGFRAYRDLSSGGVYSASNYLYNTWQESGSYSNTGYGMFITGLLNSGVNSNVLDATTGIDQTLTGAPSAYYFRGAAWNTINNTKSELLNPYQSYRVLVRGDRSFDLYTTGVVMVTGPTQLAMNGATALRATGNLITGNVTFTTSGVSNGVYSNNIGLNSESNGYSYVANPYACPIDFHNIYTSGRLTNIDPRYYYLDPTIGSTGSYVSYNAVSNTSSNNATYGQFIQAGQGFLIGNTSTSPQLQITEADKSILSTSRTSVFGTTTPNSKIAFSLLKQGGGAIAKMDGAVAVFGTQFSNAIGIEDNVKMNNSADNLSILEGGKSLSIDARLPATSNDIMGISLSLLSGTDYKLEIDATAYSSSGLTAYLRDAYKNTTTALTAGINTINFTADAKVAATYQNRFSVVFKPTTLSVNSIVATATANGNVATITWNTVGEKGVAKFEVEKSTDGSNFTSIGQQSAKNTASASYTATDNAATAATNYYRIKAVSTDGTIAYSNIAKLTNNNSALTAYNIFPNPLVGKTLKVGLNNVNAGKYVISITNVLGQRIAETTISHTGGNGIHTMSLNSNLSTGNYNVVIRDVNSKEQLFQTSLSVN